MKMQNNKQSKTFDLTKSQLLIWTGQKISPSSPMYNMALSFELSAAIDRSKFQQAFQKHGVIFERTHTWSEDDFFSDGECAPKD